MNTKKLEDAIAGALNDTEIRREALRQAIATVRKCPYGAGSGPSMVALAREYYIFLKGEDK